MKSSGKMDIIAAYREMGTYRGAAVMCGTTHKTVKCIIERQQAAGKAPSREPQAHNYDSCADIRARGNPRGGQPEAGGQPTSTYFHVLLP